MPAVVNTSKCTGCGSCVDICPVGCISLVDNKAVVDKDACIDCGACTSECSSEAITL
ncbi:MAG: 4Fe-4S binding protein [Spirochaetes bacterium]|nr:4Fe-4S binding protein [Spirochaetota bacterium]NLJ05333.1 4Fe-4S binding protein [Exilispira sp.]MBP8991460.1 4Fe-4S binding protein [Spirochaetota bacterium]HNV43842.1 4Fe-4S binding protein [Exilispira sp.]HOV46597.1 4Fe-4S binding protein [Exilispira sp.]